MATQMGAPLPLFVFALVPVLASVTSSLGCRMVRAFAYRRHLLDHPNERSLHATPVPRLGGVAIVAASWASVLVAWLASSRDLHLGSWLASSFPIALLGLVDDVRPLRAGVRMVLQLAASAAFCLYVGVPDAYVAARGLTVAVPHALAVAGLVIWLTGVLNIFNFMDGMDGLAGSQAISASLALAVAGLGANRPELVVMGLAVGGASAGFLAHNAPPASIFMGDAGSTYLGFSLAVAVVLGAAREPALPVSVAPLALAPFLFDGTFTLLRRALRGEAVWKAHRSHLYQRAVQTGLTHRQVLVPYALWCVVAAASAVAASRGGGRVLVAAIAANFAALGLIWRWVVSRERSAAVRETSSP